VFRRRPKLDQGNADMKKLLLVVVLFGLLIQLPLTVKAAPLTDFS
jgi:hypothetical protein